MWALCYPSYRIIQDIARSDSSVQWNLSIRTFRMTEKMGLYKEGSLYRGKFSLASEKRVSEKLVFTGRCLYREVFCFFLIGRFTVCVLSLFFKHALLSLWTVAEGDCIYFDSNDTVSLTSVYTCPRAQNSCCIYTLPEVTL